MRRGFRAINAGAPLDHVEIELQNALFPEDEFGHWNERELSALAEDGPARSKEQVFYELLRQGGSSARALALQIAFGGNLHLMPVEPMVLVEARILGGDDGVLEIGCDAAEGNECIAFMIRAALHPGLQAALDVDGGCRRVDPAGSYKGEGGKRPQGYYSDRKPSQDRSEGEGSRREESRGKGSEEMSPVADPGVCRRPYGHVSG